MSEPTPGAKQAANWAGWHEAPTPEHHRAYCEGYDTATAKAQELLEETRRERDVVNEDYHHLQIDHDKLWDEAAKLREELEDWKRKALLAQSRLLAHQQPSAPLSPDERASVNEFYMTQGEPSAADVDKIAGITTGAIQRTLDQTFNESARESVKTIIHEAIAQAHAQPSAPTAERKWKLYMYPDGSVSLPSQVNRGGKTITVIEEVFMSAPTADDSWCGCTNQNRDPKCKIHN